MGQVMGAGLVTRRILWEKIDLNHVTPQLDSSFFPYPSEQGRLYPIEGGMINTIKDNCQYTELNYMTFSGIKKINQVLMNFEQTRISDFLFLELLACEGGCINGPACTASINTVQKRLDVIRNSHLPKEKKQYAADLDITTEISFLPSLKKEVEPERLKEQLQVIGKFNKQDELNCGGCGYDSCRDFVYAMLDKKAEKSMCVSYMRKLAQKKANALIQTMPSGVVIVNAEGVIEECNRKFAEMLGKDTLFLFDMKPGLEGAVLSRIFPEYHQIFKNALKSNQGSYQKIVNHQDKVLNLTLFSYL